MTLTSARYLSPAAQGPSLPRSHGALVQIWKRRHFLKTQPSVGKLLPYTIFLHRRHITATLLKSCCDRYISHVTDIPCFCCEWRPWDCTVQTCRIVVGSPEAGSRRRLCRRCESSLMALLLLLPSCYNRFFHRASRMIFSKSGIKSMCLSCSETPKSFHLYLK